MRFGAKVWICRGGLGSQWVRRPGCGRWIKGTLVGARGNIRRVRLDENDVYDTVGWNKKGMVGEWDTSAVYVREE